MRSTIVGAWKRAALGQVTRAVEPVPLQRGRTSRAMIAALIVSTTIEGCALVDRTQMGGASITLPLASAHRYSASDASVHMQLRFEFPDPLVVAPAPDPIEGVVGGYAVFEPGPAPDAFWRFVRIDDLQTNGYFSRRKMPPGIFAPPKTVATSAYFRPADRRVVLDVDIPRPQSNELEVLESHSCDEIAVVVRADSDGGHRFERLIATGQTSGRAPCENKNGSVRNERPF